MAVGGGSRANPSNGATHCPRLTRRRHRSRRPGEGACDPAPGLTWKDNPDASQADHDAITSALAISRMRHDGCGGRAGKVELLTGIEGVSSRPVRRIVVLDG